MDRKRGLFRFIPCKRKATVRTVKEIASFCFPGYDSSHKFTNWNVRWINSDFYSDFKLTVDIFLQDLEGKIVVDELRPEVISASMNAEPPQCISIAWSADGQTLFAGYTDNVIRVWQVSMAAR